MCPWFSSWKTRKPSTFHGPHAEDFTSDAGGGSDIAAGPGRDCRRHLTNCGPEPEAVVRGLAVCSGDALVPPCGNQLASSRSRSPTDAGGRGREKRGRRTSAGNAGGEEHQVQHRQKAAFVAVRPGFGRTGEPCAAVIGSILFFSFFLFFFFFVFAAEQPASHLRAASSTAAVVHFGGHFPTHHHFIAVLTSIPGRGSQAINQPGDPEKQG